MNRHMCETPLWVQKVSKNGLPNYLKHKLIFHKNETDFGITGGEGAALWKLSHRDKIWANVIMHMTLNHKKL